MKIICQYKGCNKRATWCRHSYFCDEHVERGCSCNLIEDNADGEQYKDLLGRLLPCCEYVEDEDGFEDDLSYFAKHTDYCE